MNTGAVEIEGKIYTDKTTIKKTNSKNTQRVYTYEITKIELLGGKTDADKSNTPTPNNSISFANLLKDIEKDKRIWKPKTLINQYYAIDITLL